MDTNTDSKEQNIRDEHPLTNFLVLQEVLRYDTSPTSTLRNRLVSKSWLEVSSAHFLQLKKCLVLRYAAPSNNDHGNAQGFCGENSSILQMTLPEFYALYQAENPVETQMVMADHTKMILHSWEKEGTLREDKDSIGFGLNLGRWFWACTVATEKLRQLTLVHCDFRRELWILKKRFLKTMPNLEKLSLLDCVVHPEALNDINKAHQSWMEYEGREDWKTTRRTRHPDYYNVNLPTSYPNLVYYEEGYNHVKLRSLDINLEVAVKTDENDGMKPNSSVHYLRIWGPLLAMLPELQELRIGKYHENTEMPPPKLRPPGWDDDINEELNDWMQSFNLTHLSPSSYLLQTRYTWLGSKGDHEEAPVHKGNFWELFWDEAVGQVEATLCSLDLLDFSARAQQYGVLSTCEIASKIKDMFGAGRVYQMPRLRHLYFDLGLDPVFANRDITVLYRWAKWITHLKMYRAPFEKTFMRTLYVTGSKWVENLEFWGNVTPSLFFLPYLHYLRRFSWTVNCYEEKYHGKRVWHLMEDGKPAYLLTGEDLMKTGVWPDNSARDPYPNMRHLELDWGPISLESWNQLKKAYRNLTGLKAVIADDKQFAHIISLWPNLEFLGMVHGSCVTPKCLGEMLPNLTKLTHFEWLECACTRKWFSQKEHYPWLEPVKQSLEEEMPDKVIVLPWSSLCGKAKRSDVIEDVCIREEFETALRTGNSEKFFKIVRK